MPIHQHPNPCHWDIIEGVWTAGCLEQSFKFLVRRFCVILDELNAGITKLQQLNLLVIPCGVEEQAQRAFEHQIRGYRSAFSHCRELGFDYFLRLSTD
jgi:hypothetical protein